MAKSKQIIQNNTCAPVLFMAYIGAAIYFISESNGGFWEVVLGLLQAIVWPVYAIYHVLVLLGA